MIELNKIINKDCLAGLKELPDNCIDCCVTSPPYFGLRDYGTATWEGGDIDCDHINNIAPRSSRPKGLFHGGDDKFVETPYLQSCGKCGAKRIDNQIGLEETPELYVAKMVEVFTEVKRVLKKEGVMFLNLGDSYYGSGKGNNPNGKQGTNKGTCFDSPSNARRVKPYDTSDKELVNYPKSECLCGNLCGVCRKAYQIGKSHKDYLHDPMQVVSPSLPIHEHKEFENGHFPTSDSVPPVNHISNATQDSVNFANHEVEQLPSFQVSTPVEFSLPQQDNSPLLDNFSSCLLCGCSFVNSAQVSVDKSACTCDIQENGHPLNQNKSDIFSSHTAYKQYTKLKPKDLIGIPWLVAFALRESGWYLRQDIVWSKPNPMPESVTDRCTKAHEYIFLMSKSAKYYYDADAISEAATGFDGRKDTVFKEATGGEIYSSGRTHERWKKRKNYGTDNGGNGTGFQDHSGYSNLENPYVRNKRSVWTVTTKPYSDAHFATFPEDLIVDMIKAGCPEGGIVLDPFMGAGTTALVAAKLNRNFIGFELNAEYLKIAKKRLEKHLGFFNPNY